LPIAAVVESPAVPIKNLKRIVSQLAFFYRNKISAAGVNIWGFKIKSTIGRRSMCFFYGVQPSKKIWLLNTLKESKS
jgi:hypothetical protein